MVGIQTLLMAISFVILGGNLYAQDAQFMKKQNTTGRVLARNPLAPGNSGNGVNEPSMAGGPLLAVVHGGITGQPTALVAGPASVNIFQSDITQNGAYVFREMSATSTPIPYEVTPFDQKFRTAMATTFVQVTFSTQIWIAGDVTNSDAVAIECILKQTDSNNVITTSNCYGAPVGQWPTILGAENNVHGTSVWVTFSSYVPAVADQESELIVNVSTGATRARVANSQLHLAF